MPRDGKLTESDVVTLLQSGWVLVISELTRRAKAPNVQAFVVDPETEREWPVGPSAPVPWSGRQVDNQELGPRVPAQIVTGLGQNLPEQFSLAGGLHWRLWYLSLQPWGVRARGLRPSPPLRAARRVHWEQAPTPETEQQRNHERPLPAQELRRLLARGHELLRVRYWRGGPRTQPKGAPLAWVQDPSSGETRRVPAPLVRADFRRSALLPPFTRLRRQSERRVDAGRAHWEVVAFTSEPTRDAFAEQRTLTDEDGRPLSWPTQRRVLEALEQIEERVSPAPDWIMA